VKGSRNKPTDLRAQRQREQRRLFWAVVVFLVVIGTSVIALVYGPPAAALGLVCLLAGAGILGLLWLILRLIERLAE
jgi:protein-S-isoprenylcysteine O-methyltransferase Ste14